MAITFSPSSVNFGSQQINASETVDVTLTNDVATPVSVTEGTGVFSWSAATVPASGTVTITITFRPTAVGAQTPGQVSADTATCALTGVGIDQTQSAEPETNYSDDPDTPAEDEVLSRLRFHVPSWDTELTMGKGAVGTNNTYDGFGVQTDGRIFMNAASNVVMQSCGHMVVQAYGDEKNFYALAGQDATLAGVGSANIISEKGIVIAAGFGTLNVSQATGDRANLASADDTDGIDAVMETRGIAAACLGTWDAFVAGAAALRTTWSVGSTAWKHGKWRKTGQYVLGGVGAAVALTGAGLSIAGATGKADILGGTTIFGMSGVMIGSPAFSGFYSASGLVLMSAFPFLCGVDAEVLGLHSAAVTGWVSANIHGNRAVAVDSNGHVKISASDSLKIPNKYSGIISLDSKTVIVGGPHNWKSASDTTAEEVNLLTKKQEISLIDEDQQVYVKGDKEVKIEVGDFSILVEKKAITIGKTDAEAPRLKIMSNGNVALRAKKWFVRTEGNDGLDWDASGGKIKGKSIKIL